MRMGLHTGRILLGSLGEEQRLTYTAVGDATQHAAWLAQQAAPGAILVSAATAWLVQGKVRLEACAPVPLPGQNDPGTAYQLLGLGPSRSPLLTDGARPRSRFVGRELELMTLRALLTRVDGGQGQVVGIVGEPGMGKTRLLAEFCQHLGDTRVTYLEGRCVSYGQATPYGPIQDLLRHACGLTEADSPTAITANVQQHLQELSMAPAEAAPVLLHLLGMPDGAASLVGRSPQEIRTQTFATLHQLLRQESQRQPLLVVVENLHWIDPTSQEYLTEVVEWLAGMPLLLLVTFRPGYRPSWMEKSYATQLALPRLSPEDSRCVVQAVLRPAPVPEPLMQGLLAKAAGNPLFLEELAWTVREHGDLCLPPDGAGHYPSGTDGPHRSAATRGEAGTPTAAVIGTEVPVPRAAGHRPSCRGDLSRGLAHLHAAEFLYEIRPAPDRTYVFKHVLTQAAAYQSLLKRTRQQVHQRIAQVLEAAIARDRAEAARSPGAALHRGGLCRGGGGVLAAGGRAQQGAVGLCGSGGALHQGAGGAPDAAGHPPRVSNTSWRCSSPWGRRWRVPRAITAPEREHALVRARELCRQVGDPSRLFTILTGLHEFYVNRGELQKSREVWSNASAWPSTSTMQCSS